MRISPEFLSRSMSAALLLATFAVGCGGEEQRREAEARPDLRTDPFRIVGYFDPEPLELLSCDDRTPLPLRDGPEVVDLIELHRRLTPGVEPVEYIVVDLGVVGVEREDEGWLDVRVVYRAGFEGVTCPDSGAPSADAAFVGRGNEPFWRVEVTRDSLVYTRPGEPEARVRHDGILGRTATGWEVTATVDGDPLTVRFDPTGCTDSMSGAWFHLTATLERTDQRAAGCGWRPEDDAL